jgi:hypothetical protein
LYDFDAISDTVEVSRGLHHLDFDVGRLAVGLTVPSTLEGEHLSVELWGSRTRELLYMWTVEDGSFDALFPMVPPGVYRIAVGYGRQSVWLPGSLDPEEGETVGVYPDHPVSYRATLDRCARITGSVTGSWQEAHAGSPRLAAVGSGGSSIAYAYAEADGSFEVDLLFAQPVRLRIGGLGVDFWVGGDSYSSATLYIPQPGQEISGVSVQESGILCRLEGPGYLADHRSVLILRDESGLEYRPPGYGRNPVPICGLRPGRYYLMVSHEHCEGTWVPQWFDGASQFVDATPIVIAEEGELVRITAHLKEGGRVSGHIRTADGKPAGNMRVRLSGDWVDVACEARSDEMTGYYAFSGLPDGGYRLHADAPDVSPWWYPGTANADSSEVVFVKDYGSVTGIDWYLPE